MCIIALKALYCLLAPRLRLLVIVVLLYDEIVVFSNTRLPLSQSAIKLHLRSFSVGLLPIELCDELLVGIAGLLFCFPNVQRPNILT